jgi:hypothetical protein
MKRYNENCILSDWISCVIPDRIYFGPLPTDCMIQHLKNDRFTTIVNVTEDPHEHQTIHFPIKDNSIPTDTNAYISFILSLKKVYQNSSNKMYIHCKGGHSRSSMVVVSLLCCIYHQEMKHIVNKVIKCHQTRINLRTVWRHKSPFNYIQYNFLYCIHKNVYININASQNAYSWLSPKNIWIDKHTLYDKSVHMKSYDTELYETVQNNTFFMHKLKRTYLRNLIFMYHHKSVSFYNIFFKSIREHLYL